MELYSLHQVEFLYFFVIFLFLISSILIFYHILYSHIPFSLFYLLSYFYLILFLFYFIPIPSSLITFIFKIIFQGYVSTLVNFTNVVSSLITMDSNQIIYFASTNYYIYRATANQVSYGPDSSSQIYSFNMNNGM